jgi:hypothetical protein
MRQVFVFAVLALTLAGCNSRLNQTAANVNAMAGNAGTPSIFVAASPAQVEKVIIARAAAKGSVIKPSKNGKLTLERPLSAKPSEQVIAACGTSWFGRRVRVVMSLSPQNGGTMVSENRYIVGGGPLNSDCAMPLTQEDYNQSMGALSLVKGQAEAGNAPPPVTQPVPAQ